MRVGEALELGYDWQRVDAAEIVATLVVQNAQRDVLLLEIERRRSRARHAQRRQHVLPLLVLCRLDIIFQYLIYSVLCVEI